MERKIFKINYRQLIALNALLFLPLLLSSQSYIKNIAPPEIDSLRVNIINATKATKYDEVIILADKFGSYWESKRKEDKSKSVLQNYYYSKIKIVEPKIRLKNISEGETQNFYQLEKIILKALPNAIDLLGLYYTTAAEIKSKIERNFDASLIYTDKSIAIKYSKDTIDHAAIAREIISKGYSLSSLRRYDDARKCFEEALAIKRKHTATDTLSILYSLYPLGLNNYREKAYDEGLKTINEGVEIASDFLPNTHDLYLGIVRLSGILYAQIGNLPMAIERSKLALEGAKIKSKNSEVQLNFHYESLANYYGKMGKLELATACVDTAISIIKETGTNRRLAAMYLNKATFLPDVNESIKLTKKALAICPDDPLCRQSEINIMLQNLGSDYSKKGDIETGLNYVLQSTKLKEEDYIEFGNGLPQNYRSIGQIYSIMGDLDLAIEYQKKAVHVAKDFRPDTSFYVAIQESKLGNYYLKDKKLSLAEPLLLRSKTILEDQVGPLNIDLIYTYTVLAKLYKQKKNFDLALTYGYKAYDNLINRKSNISEDAVEPLIEIASIYKNKNEIDSVNLTLDKLLSLGGFSPFKNNQAKDIDVPLHRSWLSYLALTKVIMLEDEIYGDKQAFVLGKIKTCLDLIDRLRSMYFFENSELQFQNETKTFFDWSLKKLMDQYEQTKDNNLLTLAFQCIEKNKSIAINRNFIRHQASSNESIPSEIIAREKYLIIEYENAFKRYENTKDNDSLSNVYIDEMYSIQNAKELFLDSLQSKYPEYFNSRYSQQIIDLNEIQTLAVKDNRSFIINHWADSLIYQFTINPNSTKFIEIETKDILTHINIVKDLVSHPMTSQNENSYETSKSKFVNSASQLYNDLFNVSKNDTLTYDLTIISDGPLTQFPFEVLLTKQTSEEESYKTMPYLIKSHAVNYLGSANQYAQLKDQTYQSSDEYVGFAPSYTPVLSNDSIAQFRSEVNLKPLLYNIEEVNKTRPLFAGKEYIGSNATSEAFRSIGRGLGYLHLAMHTTIDDRFPQDSYLNFAIDSTSEDARLYVHQIAKMQLNHNLVVLSACETNIGKENKGVGLLGIARAFQLASCPNLIVSNWLIDDRSAGDIIQSFFQGIKNNESPSHSLREAKLEYLNNSSVLKSHPSYWAGFSYFGNPNIKSKSTFDYSKLVFLGIGLLSLILIFSFVKRQV